MDDANGLRSRREATMTSAQNPGPNSQHSVEEHLIYLSERVIHLCNARLYNDPFFQEHVSPTISTDLNGISTIGIESFINNYKVSADASPDFYTLMFNESAMVDQSAGVGTVMLSQDMNAHPTNWGRMAGTILFNWKRKSDIWILESCCMMHGTPEFLNV